MFLRIIIAGLLLLSTHAATADTVTLTNGDRVSGKLISIDGTRVVIDAPWGGRLSVKRDAVVAVETDEALGVEIEGAAVATARLAATESGEQGLVGADGNLREIGLGGVDRAYRELPRTRLADEFRLNASYGLNITSGNADTSTHALRNDISFRRETLRHKGRLELDRKIDDGNVTKDQRRASYQLDWFYREDWYAFGSSEYFADDIKDVTYRVTLGGGVGRQFWDTSLGGLSAEAGASVVIEEIGGSAEENPALRLGLDYNRFFFGKSLELFHKDELLVLTDFDRGQILNTSTGLRFALSGRWKADARVDLVYETEPAAGNDKADFTYVLGLGYSI